MPMYLKPYESFYIFQVMFFFSECSYCSMQFCKGNMNTALWSKEYLYKTLLANLSQTLLLILRQWLTVQDILISLAPFSFGTNYRPRSWGDNMFGSVRLSVRPSVSPSVRLSVRLSPLSRMNRLTYDLDFLHVGRPWLGLGWEHSKWLGVQNCCCFDRLGHRGWSRFYSWKFGSDSSQTQLLDMTWVGHSHGSHVQPCELGPKWEWDQWNENVFCLKYGLR